MMLAAALMLLAPQQGEDLVTLGLRYLARHQSRGSWGQRTTSCNCPAEPARPEAPSDAAVQSRVADLIMGLDDDDFERREESLRGLVAIGTPAVPRLRESADRGTPEVRWLAKAVLRAIASAGTSEDVETTAMALLA